MYIYKINRPKNLKD